MKYQVCDIVKTGIVYGARLFAIVRIQDGKYYAVAMNNKKRYWLEESQIAEKTGTISESSPLLLLDAAYDADQGSKFAGEMATVTKGDDKNRWLMLAALKPGEKIEVVVKKVIYPAVFVQLNLTKPVKVLRARIEGRALDLPLDTIYIETK